MRDRGSRLALLVFLVIGVGLSLASAATRGMIVKTDAPACPLCQTHISKHTISSSPSWSLRLDLLPVADSVFPRPVARCPRCGLVLHRKPFTANELARLRPFIYSAEYRELPARSDYYLLALVRERLGAGDLELAQIFLRAASHTRLHSAEWTDSMDESLRRFDRYLRTAAPRDSTGTWATAALLRGEILRQLARFAEAETHFRSLQTRSALLRTQYADFVEQELQLIAAQDRAPHQRGEPSPARLRELSRELIEKAPGAAAFLREFRVEGVHVSLDDTDFRPRSLEVERIEPRNASSELAARMWLDRDEDDELQLDWTRFLVVYRPLRAAAARHRWLEEWLRAGPQRQAVVQLHRVHVGGTPGSEQDWESLYPKLRRATAAPSSAQKKELRYEVELRCGQKVAARLQLAAGDRPVLVTEISGCDKSEHFLDQQKPFARGWGWPYRKYLGHEYLVIETDGRFIRRSEHTAEVSCPKELCTEPCQPKQYGCTGSVWFLCIEGKIAFIDLSSGGKRPYTCGDRPDGRKGELGLAGALCAPLRSAEDGPEFCAPGLACVNGTCVPAPGGSPR